MRDATQLSEYMAFVEYGTTSIYLVIQSGFFYSQRMLLHELYETKTCNSMLFPESDEEIWKHEDMQISVSPLGVHISKGDSKGMTMPVILTTFRQRVSNLEI